MINISIVDPQSQTCKFAFDHHEASDSRLIWVTVETLLPEKCEPTGQEEESGRKGKMIMLALPVDQIDQIWSKLIYV